MLGFLTPAPAFAGEIFAKGTWTVDFMNSPMTGFFNGIPIDPSTVTTTDLDPTGLRVQVAVVHETLAGPEHQQVEWLIFNYKSTVPGLNLSDPELVWQISELDIPTLVATNWIGEFDQWNDATGQSLVPTGTIFPGWSIEGSPVPRRG
jgi:hypothetical protein